ncbi:hypothetical protein GGI59_003421 [Rhizobium lentis]|uniref:Uncharacterized protein n=1 Tax=Rhizobium lentis TaxID=1138194 RepID=A0A7W8UPE2_9HYPH|nr:hypothetical protein [Rhizobium lentis]MBB5561745.1 hypothetical protein [Rhizobium lentis]MBB5568329.1 hypothetical protein [Rhizobium lentis]
MSRSHTLFPRGMALLAPSHALRFGPCCKPRRHEGAVKTCPHASAAAWARTCSSLGILNHAT